MKKSSFFSCGTVGFALLVSAAVSIGNAGNAFAAGGNVFDQIIEAAGQLLRIEPSEVQELREEELVLTDEGHQEYYFSLLTEEEQRCYRQILKGIRARDTEFYLTVSDDDKVDKVYHAVLKDHPEIYWAHNRESVYKTTYDSADYCLFAPSYLYSEEEMEEIDRAVEMCLTQVEASIPPGAGDYDKALAVYTYLVDNTEYAVSENDQNIAGVFWKKQAVCAGYAGAFQYMMEHLGIPCIYVDGDARDSTEGHAWNIILLDGEYYYVDATNGDQPEFLEGDAVQLAEHKTTIVDYFCPFPWEYEVNYIADKNFVLPECTVTDMNFYVKNQGCFDSYDPEIIYDYCVMRLNNGAAVVRFKFSSREAYEEAYEDLVENNQARRIAEYYLGLNQLEQTEYHYGVLQDLYTFYYMF